MNRPPGRRRILRLSLAMALTVSFTVCACIDSADWSLIVQNKTAETFLARSTGLVVGADERRSYESVITVGPRSRVRLAEMTFSGPVSVGTVEILTPDCTIVAQFGSFLKGGLIVVSEGPKAELLPEFPRSGDDGVETPDCRLPGMSPPP